MENSESDGKTRQPDLPLEKPVCNNFRYADDTTLREENAEELKSLLMKVKEKSEKLA